MDKVEQNATEDSDSNELPRMYVVRVIFIVVQIILVYIFSGEFQPFFYQAF